jgi:hypothetical protein
MVEKFINMFDKGLNMDYNVLYQPDGTYRYMKNCSLISQDGNNYVIKDCLGNVQVFTINYPYLAAYTVIGSIPSPIGFISFPDKLIVFSTNDETETGGYGEIGIIKYLPYGEGVQPLAVAGQLFSGYTPLYHHVSLNFTKLRQIEGFGFEENESIQRIYWTDNLSQPRTLNIADSSLTDYITSGGANPPVNGTQYMVLQGAITYDAVNYGPGLTAGNIFTATATAVYTDLTGPTPTPLIIPYTIPYNLLDFNPSRKLGTIKFDSYGDGAVYCGAKVYFYRLKNSTSGIQTSWSYGSSPIQVGTENTQPGVLASVYFDYSGGGNAALTNSNNSVKVAISDIDTDFDTLELACAEYDETIEVPRQISIVNAVIVTGTDMVVEHTGGINLGDLTLSDITLFPISIIACKTMTSNKNYILVGNITERQEYDFSNSGVSATQTDYYMPVSDSTQGCATGIFDFSWIGPNPNGNPAAGEILLGTKWIVLGPGTATYNAVVYVAGDIFTGVAGNQALTGTTGGCLVRPAVSYNKYTPINGASVRQNYIQLKPVYNGASYWNFKNPAVASHVKGYWNSEKYRFGILFYDKQGNPYYVRHLADYTFDQQNDAGISYLDTTGTVDVVGLLSHGVKFDGIELSRDLVENISGFSIVRAERDKRVLQQCAMWQVCSDTTVPTAVNYYPIPLLDNINSPQYNDNATNKFQLISPDFNCGFPGTEVTTPNYPYLELASWFDVKTTESNYIAKDVANQFETQLFDEALGDVNTITPNKIIYAQSVNENGGIGGAFNETGANFYNENYVANPFNQIDTTCPGGATDIGGATATGGKKIIIELDNTFYYYDNTAPSALDDYSNLIVGQLKANVNIVLDKTSFYGGDSEVALANTLYIQCGHYQPINATVISDNNDTNNVSTYTKLTFNDVEVYGGDAYTCLVDYGYGLYDDTLTPLGAVASADHYSCAIKFPCQLNSNYDLRSGRTTAKNRMHSTANGVVYDLASAIRLESFFYNDGYSSEGTAFAYAAKPFNYSFNDVFKNRIRFAGPKINGESINSFRTFLSADYRDMDGIAGEINNLRTKDGRTIVWQNAVISSVPIAERQVISGANGAETTIGTGGVVDRFDVINSYYGNQHQWGLTQTEYGYAWFDMRRKAFVVLDMSNGLSEVSFIDGLKGFFDEIFIENTSNSVTNNFINSPTFNKESDRPIMGVGITGVYDPKFKMTYLTFKFQYRGDKTNKDFTIGYYHPKRQFIGFYDWTPGISWNHNGLVLSSNNPKNPTKYYGAGMASTVFALGDIIGEKGKTYICTTVGTVAVYASPPSGAIFTKIADCSQLWVLNQQPPDSGSYANAPLDYQYNKFFGYVVNNEVEFVINPKLENPFIVNNIEQEGNTVNFTDIYTDAGGVTASDLSITSTDRNYRAIYDKITSSLPISSTGRITNSYLKVRWVKKNWTTDPTVLVGLVKILRYVRSFLVQKR